MEVLQLLFSIGTLCCYVYVVCLAPRINSWNRHMGADYYLVQFLGWL
jgi:hypothetical protein